MSFEWHKKSTAATCGSVANWFTMWGCGTARSSLADFFVVAIVERASMTLMIWCYVLLNHRVAK